MSGDAVDIAGRDPHAGIDGHFFDGARECSPNITRRLLDATGLRILADGFSHPRYEAAPMRGLVERDGLICEMLLHSGANALSGGGMSTSTCSATPS